MNRHVKPGDPTPSDSDQKTLRLARPENGTYALGLACEYTMTEPAFGRLGFTGWCKVLAGQIERGHYFFVIDRNDKVVGFAGWALSDHEHATAWLEHERDIPSEQCTDGDCVILNAWLAGSPAVQKYMTARGQEEFKGKRYIFAKRMYADGRVRPVKTLLSNEVQTSDH